MNLHRIDLDPTAWRRAAPIAQNRSHKRHLGRAGGLIVICAALAVIVGVVL